MKTINEQLDIVRKRIQDPKFLSGEGLSNEVNIHICCYDPKDEMIVRHFVGQITTDPSLNCHPIECDLFRIFLSICDDMEITDAPLWCTVAAHMRCFFVCAKAQTQAGGIFCPACLGSGSPCPNMRTKRNSILSASASQGPRHFAAVRMKVS